MGGQRTRQPEQLLSAQLLDGWAEDGQRMGDDLAGLIALCSSSMREC